MLKFYANKKEANLIERLIYWCNELSYNTERSPEDTEFTNKCNKEIRYCIEDLQKIGISRHIIKKCVKIGRDWRKCYNNCLKELLKAENIYILR